MNTDIAVLLFFFFPNLKKFISFFNLVTTRNPETFLKFKNNNLQNKLSGMDPCNPKC